MAGHFKKAGVALNATWRSSKGFEGEYKLGDTIAVDALLSESDFVDIQGSAKVRASGRS